MGLNSSPPTSSVTQRSVSLCLCELGSEKKPVYWGY